MTYLYKTIVLALLSCFLIGCNAVNPNPPAGSDKIVSEHDKAKQSLVKKLDKKYENPDAHYELGKLYHQDGVYGKAEFHYNVALGFDPANYKAQASLVKVYQDMQLADKSKSAAEIYLQQAANSAEASYVFGKACQELGMDNYAETAYRQALRVAPTSAVINKQMGFYYLSKGDTIRAERYLRASFQVDPYQSDVAGELGKLGVIVETQRREKDTKKLDEKLSETKE